MSDRTLPSAAVLGSAALRLARFVARHPLSFAGAIVVVVLLMVAMWSYEQRESRAGERRIQVRADMSADFIEAYIRDVGNGHRSIARSYLSGGGIPPGAFGRIVDATRAQSAVLLDAAGDVRQVHPFRPEMIGAPLAGRYEHLSRAVAGEPAVSGVVESAVTRQPVVAIATPVETPAGRRVISTGFATGNSPLTAYLVSAMATIEDIPYLVDANGVVVASQRPLERLTHLEEVDPALHAAIAKGRSSGLLTRADGAEHFFIQRRVAGTPWRFVASVPRLEVHPSADAGRHRVRMMVVGLLGAAVLLIAALLARLTEARERLIADIVRRQGVEAELLHERRLLSHRVQHDSLTGLANRSLLFDRLEHSYARCAADPDHVAGMLFVDLDRFKPINDSHGHEAGDTVLREVADRLSHAVRPTDTVARLGGDEFAVLCDNLESEDAAIAVSRRIREALERPIELRPGTSVTVGASIGVAYCRDSSVPPERLLADADAAMYAAKSQGRSIRSGDVARLGS